MKELATRIRLFLEQHACLDPNEEEKTYTSPDAHMLEACADLLEQGKIPTRCWSEWGSGGYKPYNSPAARTEHDLIVKEIYKLINNQK